MDNNYVLAVYDFRSKQDYIYKTNKVKEIMGASKLIEDAYKNAIDEYNKTETKIQTDKSGKFSLSEFEKLDFSACILYEGGGNLLMLFKSSGEFTAFNNHFSWYLIKNAPGLSPICGKTGLDKTQSYDDNVGRVFSDLGEYKRLAPPAAYADVLPFTQIDRNTSSPVSYKGDDYTVEDSSLSAESVAKHEKYLEIENDKYAKNLDDLVEKKGEESLLALIYVDGNGMGQRVKNKTNGCNFEQGVNAMREFSEDIKKAFVDEPLEAIQDKLGNLEGKNILAMRRIIGGGDEITIVCNARNALKAADIYFKKLAEDPQKFSSCMGIAVFHSHAPFADIYKIAEQCCESGKAETKIEGSENKSYVDAYFCRGAVTGEMAELRQKQEGKRTKMPYCIGEEFTRFKTLGASLKSNNIARTNVKALRDAAFASDSDFELELMRVRSNAKKGSIEIKAADMPVFCDAAAFFDLWFRDADISDLIDTNDINTDTDGSDCDASNKDNVKI